MTEGKDRASEGYAFLQVIKKAAEKKELVQVALNTHGTRAVQKLIETLTNREQVSIAHSSPRLAGLIHLGVH